jgi:hypothetical protein
MSDPQEEGFTLELWQNLSYDEVGVSLLWLAG